MDKLDKIIQEKFKNRTLKPSVSAWERLNHQLDKKAEEKPKRKWFLYIGYAASVVLLVSIFFMMNTKDTNNFIINKEIIVDTTIDSSKIKKKIFKDMIDEEAVVKVENRVIDEENILTKTTKTLLKSNVIAKNETISKATKNKTVIENKYDKVILKNTTFIAQKDVSNSSLLRENKHSNFLNKPKLRTTTKININPDDLLYEVTHTKKEVEVYYAHYNINRKEVLQTIKKQLKKSNVKIDPAIILAEVERNVNDEFFKNHFLENLKSKVSTIVLVISERNK